MYDDTWPEIPVIHWSQSGLALLVLEHSIWETFIFQVPPVAKVIYPNYVYALAHEMSFVCFSLFQTKISRIKNKNLQFSHFYVNQLFSVNPRYSTTDHWIQESIKRIFNSGRF